MTMGKKRWAYWFLAFMLWAPAVEAASHKAHAVHAIVQADSSRPTTTKKIPLRERRWFTNYRATVFKVSRVLHYIMIVLAVGCLIFVLFLVTKFILYLL